MEHTSPPVWELYSTPQKKQFPDTYHKTVNRTTASPTIKTTSLQHLQDKNSQLHNKVITLERQLQNQKQFRSYSLQRETCQLCNPTQKNHKRENCHTHQIHFSCKCAQKYQSQIKNLQTYLTSNRSSQLDKSYIMKIFGLGYDNEAHQYVSEQQLMLKQLSQKVKLLLQENQKLKSSSIKVDHCRKCDVYGAQNTKLKGILQEYKRLEIQNTQGLINQNKILSSKLMECESVLRRLQNQSKTRVSYIEVEKKTQPINIQAHKHTLNLQLQQFYRTIESKNNKLNDKLLSIENRISKAEGSISHLKFQRDVRIQNTMRKSKNFAQISRQTMGDQEGPLPVQFQQVRNVNTHPIPSRFAYNSFIVNHEPKMVERSNLVQSVIVRSENDERLKVLQQRNQKLFRENQQLANILRMKDGQINQKVQKILFIQNEMNKGKGFILELSSRVSQLSSKLESSQKRTSTKIIKSRDYSSDVKRIKQFLVSCNPTNFQKFQEQMKEIINQRNEMSQQLQILKASKFDRQQYLKIQKQSIQMKRRLDELNQKIFILQRENKILNEKCELLQKQNESIRGNDIASEIDVLNKIKNRQPQGFNGLQWQKIVRKCIQQSALKLTGLQEQMLRQMNRSDIVVVSNEKNMNGQIIEMSETKSFKNKQDQNEEII